LENDFQILKIFVNENFGMNLFDKEIKGLLTRDSVSRTTRSWDILQESQLKKIWKQTYENRCDIDDSSYFIVRRKSQQSLTEESYECFSWEEIMKGKPSQVDTEGNLGFKDNLAISFPFINEFLQEFKGKIVACGGGIFKHLYGIPNEDCDIDLFFIDSNVNSCDTSKYDDLLTEALQFLIQKFLVLTEIMTKNEDIMTLTSNRVHIVRNEFVTTLYLCANFNSENFHGHDTDIYKYQFIHRVYPNVGSILGGFDLGPCMIAFDGYRILATELGAWSAFSKTIIVDTTRRSTSFEYRLHKYSWYCNIILPGFKSDICENTKENVLSKEYMQRIIKKFARLKGYDCYFKQKYTFEHIKFKAIDDEDEPRPKNDVREQLFDLITESGYNIDSDAKILFDQFWNSIKSSCIEKITDECNLDQLHSYLRDLCKIYNFTWRTLAEHQEISNKGCVETNNYIELPNLLIIIDDEGHFLRKNRLKKLTTDILEKHVSLTVEPDSRDRAKKLSENTKRYQSEKVNIRCEKVSDYNDTNIFPNYTGFANATALRCGKFNSVGALTTLVTKNNKQKEKEMVNDNYAKYASTVSGPFIELNSNDLSFEQQIKQYIKDNINKPQFGNVEFDIEFRINSMLIDAITFYHNGDDFILDFERDDRRETFKRRLTRLFAEYNEEIYNIILKTCNEHGTNKNVARTHILTKLKPYIDIMTTRLQNNIIICQKNLSGIKWITENPGRQWTSSINPIIEDPREWYGEKYVSFVTGFPKEEQTLRLIKKRSKLWNILNKDIFNMVLKKYTIANSY